MKTGITILAGLLAGILVAVGILAAFIFVGPDPVGLRPTPPPTLVPATPSPAPSVVPSPSVPAASASTAPGASAAGSPGGSVDPSAALHIGQPAPALVVPQLGGGTIDLANLRGKAVWLSFMQTSCAECVAEFTLMNGFAARYANDGLVVIAVDIREEESVVTQRVLQLKPTFLVGLDGDGTAQQAWGTAALPTHVWIDTAGVVRDGAIGAVNADVMVAALRKILPGVNVTP